MQRRNQPVRLRLRLLKISSQMKVRSRRFHLSQLALSSRFLYESEKSTTDSGQSLSVKLSKRSDEVGVSHSMAGTSLTVNLLIMDTSLGSRIRKAVGLSNTTIITNLNMIRSKMTGRMKRHKGMISSTSGKQKKPGLIIARDTEVADKILLSIEGPTNASSMSTDPITPRLQTNSSITPS